MDRRTSAPAAAPVVRRFGRFELRALLGRSERTMLWLSADPRSGHELMLAMPRAQPPDEGALEQWLDEARRATRVAHPQLAHAVEVGSQEHWPYIAYDRAGGLTLPEWLAPRAPLSPVEVSRLLEDVLQALAFVHDAGHTHRDLQPYLLQVADSGRVRLLGLGCEAGRVAAGHSMFGVLDEAHAGDAAGLNARRDAIERDVLAAGVLLHALLAGEGALEEPDTGRVIDRIAPLGRELLLLPRVTPQPVPAPLRVIVNRATNHQVRLRYRSARTLLHALHGWREAHERQDAGPVALLLERVSVNGHLPALPGVGARAARLALMERGRTQEMAELIVQDMALAFELLRNVNSAQVQGTQISGNGPVLTVRRAIAMLGLAGVRRAAASLRAWPGPLDAAGAAALGDVMDTVRMAGRVAQLVRPPGFDAEVVYLVTLLQNLGRLVVQYHFPEEAQQVRALMRPAAPERAGEAEQPGLDEATASTAVFGLDIETLGAAVARQWGLTDEVLHMIRRLNPATPVRNADRDDDLIRAAASCGNEAVDVLALPAQRQAAAIDHVAQRYAKLLSLTPKDLREAVQRARRPEPGASPAAGERGSAGLPASPQAEPAAR